MKALDLFNSTLDLLEQMIFEAAELAVGKHELRNGFIHWHARNVLAVGRDVSFLYSQERYAAAQIAIRSMIESSFCIAAGCRLPTFHAEKMIAHLEERAKHLMAIGDGLNSEDKEVFAKGAQLELDRAAKLRAEYSISSSRKWNAYDMATAGAIEKSYRIGYFHQSEFVHGNISALMDQDTQSKKGDSLVNAFSAVISSLESYLKTVPTKTPQQSYGKNTGYLVELRRLMASGEI